MVFTGGQEEIEKGVGFGHRDEKTRLRKWQEQSHREESEEGSQVGKGGGDHGWVLSPGHLVPQERNNLEGKGCCERSGLEPCGCAAWTQEKCSLSAS